MVWICNECEKDRHEKCKLTSICCNCWCNDGGFADYSQKALAITGGIGMAVGGLALTLLSGGLALPIGGAIMGAGISSTWQGVEKSIKKERLNGLEYCADVGFGALTGVVTSGVGAVGETVAANVVKQGAKVVAKAGAQKLAVRAAAGSVTGVASKAIDEVKTCTTTDKKWSDFGKSFNKNGDENGTAVAWVASAFVGALGGVGGHVSSNCSKAFTSGVAESVVRVGVSGTTAAVGDSVAQGANIAVGNQDSYDMKRTVTSFAASSITAAASESAKNAIYQLHGGKSQMLHDKTNKEMIKEKVPKNDQKSVLEGYEELKKIPQSRLDEEAGKSVVISNENARNDAYRAKLNEIDGQIKETKTSIQREAQAGNTESVKQQQQTLHELKTAQDEVKKFDSPTRSQFQKQHIEKMNNRNAHFLVDDKVGQVAFDVNSPNSANRGANRAIFDYEVNDRAVFKYSGYTNTHDYASTPNYGAADFEKFYGYQENRNKMMNGLGNNITCNKTSLDNEKEEKKKSRNEEENH